MMERYTYFEGGKWRLRVGDTEYSGPWVDRLAAYEDTGLEPEEVQHWKACFATPTMQHLIEMCEKIEAERDTYRALGTVEELSALVKARNEGRVVVLPCKVGDTVYVPDRNNRKVLGKESGKCHLTIMGNGLCLWAV